MMKPPFCASSNQLLEANNYEMTTPARSPKQLKQIATRTPDIVLLDLGLPDGDGKDVIRQVRKWSDVPIIVLSARDREAEKIEALDLGGDDFVNKPFGVGELLARMRTALAAPHRAARRNPVLRTADLEIDSVRHRVMRANAEVKLTPKEFELLSFLARHAGKGRHPSANPDGRVGAGTWRGYAISAGLYRPVAPEGGARSRRSTNHHHRAGNWLPDRGDRQTGKPVGVRRSEKRPAAALFIVLDAVAISVLRAYGALRISVASGYQVLPVRRMTKISRTTPNIRPCPATYSRRSSGFWAGSARIRGLGSRTDQRSRRQPVFPLRGSQ